MDNISKIITCNDIPEDSTYISILITDKDNDYKDEDTVDEFGDKVEGAFHEGKTYSYTVQIDFDDMESMKEKDLSTYTTASNNKADTSVTSSKAKTTIANTITILPEQDDDDTETNTKITEEKNSKSTTSPKKNPSTSYKTSSAPLNVTTKTNENTVTQHTEKYTNPKSLYTTQTQTHTYKVQTHTTVTTRATHKSTTKKATNKVTVVTGILPYSMSLNTGFSDNNVKLNVGEKHKISAVFLPYNTTNKNVTWSSNRSFIASIDSNGNIKGVSSGIAIITATSKANSNFTASCMVTVS